MSGLTFMYVVLAGVSLAGLAIGFRLAASGIHPALGTVIVSGVAFLVNIDVVLSMKAAGVPTSFSMRSIYVLAAVGVATACTNLSTLAAYANGLQVTASFLIGGISAILMLLVGFLILEEPFTWMRLLAIGLILTGIFLLQRTSG
jgi:multidrug transporter EmrE-like cation transporter